MIRFSLLASGSRGNALFVQNGSTSVLVDNGLSLKELKRRMAIIGQTVDCLQAVIVTHEHRDHVAGLGVLARRVGVPVYMTEAAFAALPDSVGRIPAVEHFEAGDELRVESLSLRTFSVSHDAADPVGMVVEGAGIRLGLATDLGHVPHLVRQRLTGCHGLIIESNYCPDMLRTGPYPPMLQQRVRSRHGHLSNPDMGALLGSLVHGDMTAVVLAHLSEENNRPDIAKGFAVEALSAHPARLVMARQDHPTQLFAIGQ